VRPRQGHWHGSGLSKTQQRTTSFVEVDVDLGEARSRTDSRSNPSTSLAATSSNCYWDP